MSANDAGVLAIWPALTSAALVAVAVFLPRRSKLGRLWAWIALLGACGFSSRAISDIGWWAPTIWPAVIFPVYRMSREGAFWRLVSSSWAVLRYGAAALAVSLVIAAGSFFPPQFSGQVAAEHLIYPCIVGAAAAMLYALTRKDPT